MKNPKTEEKNIEPFEKKQINDLDLHYNQYSETILEKNIDRLFRKTLLNTQKLGEEFCAKHIYSMKIPNTPEYEEMDINDIIKKQPHLDKKKLEEAIHRLWNDKNKINENE